MTKSCIYIIKSHLKPNKYYIGSAKDFQLRKDSHKYLLRRNKHPNIHLQRHINKYSIQDIYFEILEKVDNIENLIEREQYHIDNLKPLFNICKIAGNTLGRKFSEATKNKIRIKAIGRVMTEETRLKMSISRKGNKNPLGNKASNETKQKMSVAQKNRWNSPKTINND